MSLIRRIASAGALLSMFALGACAPPPTTTYTNAAGQEVTVNWKDFPAYAMSDPDELLAAPPKEKAEAVSVAMLGEIKGAFTAEFGVRWDADGEAGWYPEGGNGYGGQAMTTTFNSVSWTSSTAPADTASWERILAITNRITSARGLGAVKLSPNANTFRDDPAWHQELVEKYGTADLEELYWWNGTAHGDSQWLSLSIVNVDRDTTGAAAKEYSGAAGRPRSISLNYGVTTLAEADLPAFKQALEPFAGLTPPEPTTSD